MQKIKELIKPQLDDLFVDIHKMVKKSLDRQPSPPEVLTKEMQQKLDQQIAEKWHDIKDSVDCLSQKLSRDEQSKLMQFTEDEFNKRRKQFNQNVDKKSYRIKLNPHTKRIVLPRKIESTESRLEQGHLHIHVLKELRQYWQDSFEYWNEPKYLWGNLCLSFIYISGCADEQHLIAIQKQLQEAIELGTDLNCFRLYHSDYKKITNPLLLHYRVENSQYGNDVEQGKLYQWKHVFFNPYAQFILQYLKKLKATQKEFCLQHSVEDCILESLSKIGRKKSLGDLQGVVSGNGKYSTLRIFTPTSFNDIQHGIFA